MKNEILSSLQNATPEGNCVQGKLIIIFIAQRLRCV